jgi:hypothetical protein
MEFSLVSLVVRLLSAASLLGQQVISRVTCQGSGQIEMLAQMIADAARLTVVIGNKVDPTLSSHIGRIFQPRR